MEAADAQEMRRALGDVGDCLMRGVLPDPLNDNSTLGA